MKTNPDPDPEDALLEAVLRDDGWQAAHAAGKAQALGVFRAQQRVRRWTRWAGGAAALAILAACVAHRLAGSDPQAPPRRVAVEKASAPLVRPEKPTYLTDDQLIDQFPEGSCFLAEVDGKKKLVFFDPKVEREYVSDVGDQRSFAR